jgi:hypothetical protein
MSKFLRREDSTAKKASNIITNQLFGVSPKIKINRNMFNELIMSMYINGEKSAITRMRMLVQDNPDITISEFLGELVELESAVVNEFQNTKMRKKFCTTSFVENIHAENKIVVKGI